MPDEPRSLIKHHLVLHRIDPEQVIRRVYSVMIERDLFGTVRLVRNWGRIGTNGHEQAEVFAGEIDAGEALEALARAKRKEGVPGSVMPITRQSKKSARCFHRALRTRTRRGKI
jgi:predicted DNA-binding WGR domain protein